MIFVDRQNARMDKLKQIGGRVAALRGRLGMTQADFAEAVGIARSTLAGIESGGDRGGILSMIAIADYCEVPMDWLLCRSVPGGGPLVGQFIEKPSELGLMRFWRSLPADEQLAVTRLLHIPAYEAAD